MVLDLRQEKAFQIPLSDFGDTRTRRTFMLQYNTALSELWNKGTYLKNCICTDYYQRTSKNVTKWRIFKMETISIWAIARQKSCVQLYLCLDLKHKVSLSLDRGKSGYEINASYGVSLKRKLPCWGSLEKNILVGIGHEFQITLSWVPNWGLSQRKKKEDEKTLKN